MQKRREEGSTLKTCRTALARISQSVSQSVSQHVSFSQAVPEFDL